MIFLDTCVLSFLFRKTPKKDIEQIAMLRQMISDDWPLVIPGIVFQECLSGVKDSSNFVTLQTQLEAFPIILSEKRDHILGAQIRNKCLNKGIAATTTDCLIAASCINHQGSLLTFDKDFDYIARCSELRQFSI